MGGTPPAETFAPSDPEFRERIAASFARQGLMETLGAELTRVEPGFCEIGLPFRPGLSQQHGYFHAGAIGAIADSAGGYAAYSLMGAADSVLSVEYKLNLLAPGRGERLEARGRVLRAGRTLTVCRVDVFAVFGRPGIPLRGRAAHAHPSSRPSRRGVGVREALLVMPRAQFSSGLGGRTSSTLR